MGKLYIKGKQCYFCGMKLNENKVIYRTFNEIKCLECKRCKVFLYTEKDYDKLNALAKNEGRKLNRDVYKYEEIKPLKNKIIKTNIRINTKVKKKNKKKNKELRPKLKLSSNPSIEVQTTKYKTPTEKVNVECSYLRKNHCIYIDDSCRPYSLRCKLKKKESEKSLANGASKKEKIIDIRHTMMHNKSHSNGVVVIVITDNRKCIYEMHKLLDSYAISKVVNKKGIIQEVKIPAAYCEECGQYIVLKSDFEKAKNEGVLLCMVENYTQKFLHRHNNYSVGNESRIHQLGYNVIQSYGYTDIQRQVILANIIENTNISQQEILSIIDINIARHKTRNNYANAVEKWSKDREFVSNYQLGDCSEVILEYVKIGRR